MKPLKLNKNTIELLSEDIVYAGGFTGSDLIGDNTTNETQQNCKPGLPTYPVSCKPRDCCNGTMTCETIYHCNTWSYRGCNLKNL